MPYCVQCGTQVGDRDRFCAKCGTSQPAASAGPGAGYRPAHDFFANLNNRTASLLCYVPVAGWIMSIIVLASDRFRRENRVRFHAFQGLYLFAAWLLVDWLIAPGSFGPGFGPALGTVRTVEHLLKLVIFGAWIFMLIRVSHDEDYHLPIIGELAERSVSEQQP